MSTPRWAVGMLKLGPGIYCDKKTQSMHISEQEICDHFGVPCSEENAQMIVRALGEVCKEAWPGKSIPLSQRFD